MNAHASLKSVDIGTDMNAVLLAARAVEVSGLRYQAVPNYPECQPVKEAYWRDYQKHLAELMEAIHDRP